VENVKCEELSVSGDSERSRPAIAGQHMQDDIDRVFLRCYGLSDHDARYISLRLKEML
jgi:hypothetical protein